MGSHPFFLKGKFVSISPCLGLAGFSCWVLILLIFTTTFCTSTMGLLLTVQEDVWRGMGCQFYFPSAAEQSSSTHVSQNQKMDHLLLIFWVPGEPLRTLIVRGDCRCFWVLPLLTSLGHPGHCWAASAAAPLLLLLLLPLNPRHTGWDGFDFILLYILPRTVSLVSADGPSSVSQHTTTCSLWVACSHGFPLTGGSPILH